MISSLSDYTITRDNSATWQKVARVEPDVFEDYVAMRALPWGLRRDVAVMGSPRTRNGQGMIAATPRPRNSATSGRAGTVKPGR